jgi:hypothetical protein
MSDEEVVEQTERTDIDPASLEINFSEHKTRTNAANVSRFEGRIHRNWNGVKSCCDGNRVNDEAGKALETWSDGVRNANPSWRVVQIGILPDVTAHCESRRPTGGTRHCMGRLEGTGYIEYYENS